MWTHGLALRAIVVVAALLGQLAALNAAEPPALNPFGQTPSAERDDAVPGYIELSDGSIHPGQIYLTRDKRLQMYDKEKQRQREIPLTAITKVECSINKEWMEREWKFRELANDEKLYTGRVYPVREYVHTITLKDGRTITGPLATIVYVEPLEASASSSGSQESSDESERFMISKRSKGEIGKPLKSLIYVKSIKLGKDALEEGLKKSPRSGSRRAAETTNRD